MKIAISAKKLLSYLNNMLYDVKTTRKLEKKIISQNNPELSLMFKAGTGIFNHINELNKKDIIILIGPGNNGGDGYALAIQAFLNNYNINCIELIESKGTSKKLIDCIQNFSRQALHASTIRFPGLNKDDAFEFKADLPQDIKSLIHLMK